jgi:hypothetical protein
MVNPLKRLHFFDATAGMMKVQGTGTRMVSDMFIARLSMVCATYIYIHINIHIYIEREIGSQSK